MAKTMDWAALGIGSAVAFVLGLLYFGLPGAIVLTVVVITIQGILRYR